MKGSCGVWGLALAMVAGGAWGGPEAMAQSAAGWGSYSPNVAWAAPVATTAPTTTVVNPGTSGWAGYAPATVWAPYQPQAAWTGYAPQAGWTTGPAVASQPSPRLGGPIGSWNPEYGTGRTIAMHKPWLPASPR